MVKPLGFDSNILVAGETRALGANQVVVDLVFSQIQFGFGTALGANFEIGWPQFEFINRNIQGSRYPN